MLIDGGAAINLMPYAVFKKLRQEDDELVKTKLTLNGMGENSMEARGVVSMELTLGKNHSLLCSLSSRCKVTIELFLVMIGFTSIVLFLLLCTNS
jgi:hypothetical protein